MAPCRTCVRACTHRKYLHVISPATSANRFASSKAPAGTAAVATHRTPRILRAGLTTCGFAEQSCNIAETSSPHTAMITMRCLTRVTLTIRAPAAVRGRGVALGVRRAPARASLRVRASQDPNAPSQTPASKMSKEVRARLHPLRACSRLSTVGPLLSEGRAAPLVAACGGIVACMSGSSHAVNSPGGVSKLLGGRQQAQPFTPPNREGQPRVWGDCHIHPRSKGPAM